MSRSQVRILLLLFRCQVVSSSFAAPWTLARQAPLSMGFPRQEHWSELPFLSPGDLPNLGTEPRSPTLQADVKNIKGIFDSNRIQSVDCFGQYGHFYDINSSSPRACDSQWHCCANKSTNNKVFNLFNPSYVS